MSTVLTRHPLRLFGAFDDQRTLDDAVCDVWAGLRANAAVACPVCGGQMRPFVDSAIESPGTRRLSGKCADCRSTLS